MSFLIPNSFAEKTGSVQLSLLDDNFTYLTTSLDSLQTNIDNINLLQLSSTATGITGVNGILDNILPSGETSGYVLTTSGAGSYYWAAAGGGGSSIGTRINTSRQAFTATASQTVFTLTGGITYVPGSGQLRVYIDGVRQFPDAYTETSATVFTLSTGVSVGTIILAEIDGYVSYPILASDISNSPAGNISATTVQAAIDELDSEKAALTSFTNSLSGNGYQKLPGGLVIAWASGVSSNAEAEQTIALPYTFTTIYNVQCSTITSPTGTPDRAFQVRSWTTSSVVVFNNAYNTATGSGTPYILVIGI